MTKAKKLTGTLEAMYEDGTLMTGDDPRLVVDRLPVGIKPLDDFLGGGFPLNRVTMIYGPESTGKTLLCQYATRATQQAGKRVLLLDAERSYDKGWWDTTGVDTDALIVSQPATGEKAIDVIEMVLKADPDIGLVVVDSLAALHPAFIIEESAESQSVAMQPRLLGRMFAKVLPLLHGRAFMSTNQIRIQMTKGAGGVITSEGFPGGWAVRHNTHMILRTKRDEWLADTDKRRYGFVMEIWMSKNKTGAPQGHLTLPIRFDTQIDVLTTMIDDAIDRGLITVAGPWITLPAELGGGKVIGKLALRQRFIDNEDEYAKLEKLVGTE